TLFRSGLDGRPGRNVGWRHLALADVISMPDEWEYPWFAAWDLAFHTVPLAHIDPEFAKHQLVLMCREWAQHPNGQLPAYEWAFEDVNPPVHAWACWQVYAIDGGQDQSFLIQVFNKLLLNFSWWVNRKDADGTYLFEGGFLGMDNITLFDRSTDVPPGYKLEQSDATSWMAFFSQSMLRMALELARRERGYDNAATTFLQYFINLARAMDRTSPDVVSSLWNEEDGFFYDALSDPAGHITQLRVRSMVGLLPLMAVLIAPSWVQHELPDFVREVEWMMEREPAMMKAIAQAEHDSGGEKLTLSLISKRRRDLLLKRLFDEEEFLSEYGIRSLSAAYREEYTAQIGGREMSIHYTPGESDIDLFGGNSNWRGPVWFPVNFLVVDALRLYAASTPGDTEYEYPTNSGRFMKLSDIVLDLEDRLTNLFRLGPNGRPGDQREYPEGPLWDEHVTFSEYFHGDTGVGLGAAHQTGWTALVAHYICSDHAPALPGLLPGE
ncbi:MAG TPA: glucosidase, partial [Dermacoccus sp.]|nr:glucosidase [Dermacoccus sp.]